MNSYEKFYPEKMYPLQDGVMDIITKLNTPFFLTGGTVRLNKILDETKEFHKWIKQKF
jgi:hypothetical protein